MSKLTTRRCAAVAAVGLTLATIAISSAANAYTPTVNTVSILNFTMPTTQYTNEYAGLEVDLSSVSTPGAITVTVNCDGHAPFSPLLYSVDSTSHTAVFIAHESRSLYGQACTIHARSNYGDQTVVFSPGTFVSTDKYVPITAIHATVVTHLSNGGL